MFHIGLQALRGKIRGLQAAGETTRHRISKSSGLKRARLWSEKRQLGVYNRYHLIAYGLLRNMPYSRIEKCDKHNRPDAQRVLQLLVSHAEWEIEKLIDINVVKLLLDADANLSLREAITKVFPDRIRSWTFQRLDRSTRVSSERALGK